MKVTNWCRKMVATILAGGALSPGLVHAVSIPLGDPSFELYDTTPHGNFAYAAPDPAHGYTGAYRPTSPWVDDLNSPLSAAFVQHTQDDLDSNWLYNNAYAELGGSTGHFRGSPRTGTQAMHGLHSYSAQTTTTNFASEKFYTFSIWAQGDADAIAADDSVYLYIYNGNIPFKETNALEVKGFQGGPGGSFANRGPTMNATQSKANWTQISITHVVYPDSPEVGKPIGVGFYGQRDAAVDDASLDVDDAANHLLVLEVNTTNGQVRLRNQTPAAIKIDYYDIKSSNGALNPVGWSSLQDQNVSGFPPGHGSGDGWEEAGGSSSNALGESYLTGSSSMTSTPVGLGAAYSVGGTHDLIFEYGAQLLPPTHTIGDYNDDGVVNAADYVVWRKKLNQSVTLPNDSTPGTVTNADYIEWRNHFGKTLTTPPSTLVRGLVHYVTAFSGAALGDGSVPEPSCVLLVGAGLLMGLTSSRRRKPPVNHS